jgi:aminopeptidase YwaD
MIGSRMVRYDKNIRMVIAFAVASLLSTGVLSGDTAHVSAERLAHHVHILASDSLGGRRAGSEYERMAADYIASEFIRYGLRPHPDSSDSDAPEAYMQFFEFPDGFEMSGENYTRIIVGADTIDLNVDEAFQTLPFSSSDAVSGPVVFSGFGISAPDQGYDDYRDTDVTGSIVLVIQGSPDIRTVDGILNQYATARNKTSAAREAGAAGMIIVTNPDRGDSRLMDTRHFRTLSSMGIPVINITPETADRLLGHSNATISELYEKLLEERKPNAFVLNGLHADLGTNISVVQKQSQNVIGYLPGRRNAGEDYEVIVIGAHYDHLGRGGRGSLSPGSHGIHNGADDNASGTAGMLELARVLSENYGTLNRGVLFIAFGAEELGLIGSRHYVAHPYIPNERTAAMINLDMIGRMEGDRLTVFGTGTSPVWGELLEGSVYYDSLEVSRNPAGSGPSDHASFYAREIPVLFFHTGLHADYHRPSDTADRINYTGIDRIVRYVKDIIGELDRTGKKIAFTGTGARAAHSTLPPVRVYVGTMPDYSDTSSDGIRLAGIGGDSPAERAGLQSGDILVAVGGRRVQDIDEYTEALAEFNPGDVIAFTVRRNGNSVTFEVELGERR